MKDSKTKKADTAPQTGAAKKHLPLFGKVLLALLCLLAALAVLAGLYLNGKLSLIRYDDGTVDSAGSILAEEDQDLDTTGLAHTDEAMQLPEADPFASEDVLNILLISTDERTEAVNDADAFTHLDELDGTRASTEFSDDARADSLILVSLDIKQNTIKLVSIERGTGVPIDAEGYEGEYDWITHTFRYGGAKLTIDTVEKCFGVQVDHYVRINFNSFVQIVDAVGGVDIELSELEAQALNWEVPSNSMLIVDKVSPGLNHFDGYTALQYARLRQIDNDWQRVARQRTVIQAVLNEIRQANVAELDSLLNTVLPLIQTNFTKAEITALLPQLPAFLGVQAEQLSLPAENTYGVRRGMDERLMYDPDWAVNRRILQRFLYGTATQGAVRGYLQDNSTQVDLQAGIGSADFGSSDYTVFMAGQSEDQAAYSQKMALLRCLNTQQGVNVLVEPCGVASGLLLSRYLETGSEEILQQYMQAQQGTARCTVQEADFWRWLYAYNQAQGQHSAVQVAGIGADADGSTTAAALALLLRSDAEIADDLQPLAFLIRQQNPYAAEKLRAALDKSFYHARSMFAYEDWPLVKQLLAASASSEAGEPSAEKTDEELNGEATAALLADFAFVMEQYPEEKYFIQLETPQIMQAATTLNAAPLAAALNAADGLAAGRVCSILPVYIEGERAAAQLNPAGIEGGTVLESLLPSALRQGTLIALDGPASPFSAQNGFFTPESADDATPAASLFQKVLTIPAEGECTAYTPEK